MRAHRALAYLPLLAVLLLLPAGATVAQVPAVATPAAPSDEQLLKSAGLSPAGPDLVAFFQQRAALDLDHDKLLALVEQLGDKDPQVRDQAAAGLLSRGPLAIPALRRSANSLVSSEGSVRARQCLAALEGASGSALSIAAVHLLARSNPPGAAAALLAYLPFAEDDQVADEISRAVNTIALRDGKPDPALLQALKDSVPLRRALAGEVLSRVGGVEEREALRTLLQDPRPTVRLRVALALAEARDAEAVSVLIALLADLPADQARQVEDFLTNLAGDWAVKAPVGDDTIARRARHDVWAAWWQAVDGPTLVAELRKRSLSDADCERAQQLIHQLAADKVEQRDRALTDLVALGSQVIPLLRRAAADHEAGNAAAAEQALQLFQDKGPVTPLPAAAPRLLALRKPEGAVEALLAYLPLVDPVAEAPLAEEIDRALGDLAERDGKVDPALLDALKDNLPVRRAVAAEAICRVGPGEHRAAVHRLLADPDLTVRMRAGLALARAQDREAIPVLIALLTELPGDQAAEVETYLSLIAGDQTPATPGAGEADARKKTREAWSAWWSAKGDQVTLPRLDNKPQQLGFTLIVDHFDPTRQSGRVFEVDIHGKQRWAIEGLQGPIDAQMIGNDRVLILEQNTQRLSERDLKGKVLWEKVLTSQVLSAQRTANGNTFIATRNQLLEMDRNGKEVTTYNRPANDIMAAQRLKDGGFAFMTYAWQYTRVDPSGREQKTARVGGFQFTVNPSSIEVLPNDHVLIAVYNFNKVAEYDLAGKVLWEASVPGPTSVSRLPNGNTLVASNNFQRICELDRGGKVVWEYKEANVRPWRAKRR